LILGLGAGYHEPEYKAFGYPFDHLVGRFEESLKIIHTLLREGSIDFQGQYYTTRDCELRPRGPTRIGPPILIGAKPDKPRALRLTAQYADY
jgi:alkanesulfonate monooxygenase SsuD/methylene tetrahydromethanopterin reductase-like flavin-dependent oxidoreductase (luciferase family)